MALTIQLATTDEVLNVNPDPEGLNKFELELKRSKEHDGVFYEFGVNLKFFKKARRLIRDVYEAEGIDGKIECRIYEYLPNEYRNEKIYTGQLRLKDYEIGEIGVEVNVEQEGIEREFINKMKIDRAISTPRLVPVPPKTILQRFKGVPSSSDTFTRNAAVTFNFSSNSSGQSRSAKRFLMFEVGEREFSEFDSLEEGGLSYVVSEFDAVQFLEVLPEEQGIYDFDFVIRNAFSIQGTLLLGTDVDVGASSTHTPPLTIKLFFERRDSTNNTIEKVQVGSTFDSVVDGGFGNDIVTVPFETRSYSASGVQLNTGDRVYLYYEIELSSNDFDVAGQPATVQYDFLVNADVGGTFNDWNFEFNGLTQYPETDVQFQFPFELFESLVSQNTNGQIGFKSNFFGRTDIDYDEDGKGSLIAHTNGHKLRQANSKRMFNNFEDAFNSYNSMFCLGWEFETDPETGKKYIRIEEKSNLYDSSAISLTVTNSKGLVKRANSDLYYTRIEVGYPKFENLGAANSIDEFNTQRKYSVNISQADNSLELFSKFRASCYEIESQRRQELNSEGNKLDDENFIIALKRISSSVYAVETGADYTTIDNIFDPDTAFNIRLRPSSFIENWRSILSSVTFRKSDKSYNFNSGTGNYDLEVDGSAEDRDIVMKNEDAIYLCEELEFETGLNSTERKLIVNNPKQLVDVRDWVGNSVLGFLLSSKTVLEEKKSTFILLRANAKKTEEGIVKL